MKKQVIIASILAVALTACGRNDTPPKASSQTPSQTPPVANKMAEGIKYANAALAHFPKAEKACWAVSHPTDGDSYVLLVKFPDTGSDPTGWQNVAGWTLYNLDNGTAMYVEKQDGESFESVTPDITGLPCADRTADFNQQHF